MISLLGRNINLAWSDAAREAAIAARQASEKAEAEPTKENHQAAAVLHSTAAKEIDASPHEGDDYKRSQEVSSHLDYARFHRKQAKTLGS